MGESQRADLGTGDLLSEPDNAQILPGSFPYCTLGRNSVQLRERRGWGHWFADGETVSEERPRWPGSYQRDDAGFIVVLFGKCRVPGWARPSGGGSPAPREVQGEPGSCLA